MKNDLYVAYHPVDGPVLHSLRESEEQVKRGQKLNDRGLEPVV